MIDKHKQLFAEEAHEILIDLETALLDLEAAPQDGNLVNQVFRALHTLKGSGAMFGFEDIAHLTHEVETVYDLVRSGNISVTKEIIDLTLLVRDQVKMMLDAAFDDLSVDAATTNRLIESFRAFLPSAEQVAAKSAGTGKGAKTQDQHEEATYRIRFAPPRNIFLCGGNPVGLLRELASLGRCRTVVQLDRIPSLGEMNAEECYLYWDVLLTTDKGMNAIRDVFIFVEDESDIKIDVIDSESWMDDTEEIKKLGEILVEKGDISPEVLQDALEHKQKLGEELVDSGMLNGGKVDSALAEQEHLREARLQRRSLEQAASIRVKSDKLDSLVNLVGEMVTVQARLSQVSAAQEIPELTVISEIVERLTWEMRDQILNIRMIPIGTTFTKYNRLVRDLSSELGKVVDLVTEGGETELDKTVIERLGDPLVHLIRNCIDHGIESPEVRRGAGKPARGTVKLSAEHAGAHVMIRIEDDGAGLDAEAIRIKAVNQGLITENQEISERELYALIFSSGFSTAKRVTSVSGRGVGMDVVRKAIDELRGTIDIQSRKGKGSSFHIKLPLTLAIIDGLLVKIADKFFVLPLSAVEECVEITRKQQGGSGRDLANVRGELIPYIRLREKFDIEGDAPSIEQVVIVNVTGDQIGFVVDKVIGGHQTVIKSLGSLYKDIEGLSGATILGDGTVALILDLPHLIRGAELDERELTGASKSLV